MAPQVYSNPPFPAQSNSVHKPETDPAQKNKNANADHRGTETSPLFIKVIPPAIGDPEAPKEHHEARDYTSAEWWLVYITGALVLSTIGLMIYTARLWRETKNLARDAKMTSIQQAKDTEEALRIADESADAASTTAKMMVASQRPYIYVIKVSYVELNSPDSYVRYTIANYGELPAIIEEPQVIIGPRADPDDFPLLLANDHPLVMSPVFLPHEDRVLYQPLPEGVVFTKETRRHELLFQVIIRYSGPITKGHKSAFCWMFDGESESLVPYGYNTCN